MAKPIEPTPKLEGEDAKKFLDEIALSEHKRYPESEVKNAFELYQSISRKPSFLSNQ